MTTQAATIWLLIALVFTASGNGFLAAFWRAGAVLWLVAGRLERCSKKAAER